MNIIEKAKNIKVNEKAVWGLVAVGASLLSLVAGQKNDTFAKADMAEEAAKKAKEMLMEEMSKQS